MVACPGTSEVLDHTRNFHDFLNHPVPWISKVRTRGDINIKCNKHYQSNTCNKLPQSAHTLNFLQMVSLCLYSKCSKSLVYHGRPSPGSCEANSKKSLIWRDALLLVLDSSPPSVPILSLALFCTKRGVALLVVGSSVSILNLALFCTKRGVALLVVGSSVSILNLALFCSKRGVALLVVGSSVSILNLALFCSKLRVALLVVGSSVSILNLALFCSKRGVALLVVGSSVSILNLALFCSKRGVALLVVDSSVWILNLASFCFVQNVESLCSFLNCL